MPFAGVGGAANKHRGSGKKQKEEEKRKKKKKRRKNAGAAERGPVLPPARFRTARRLLSDTGAPMYFQEPTSFLRYAHPRGQNLFLIQNSQEVEQALEELKQTFRITADGQKDSRPQAKH